LTYKFPAFAIETRNTKHQSLSIPVEMKLQSKV